MNGHLETSMRRLKTQWAKDKAILEQKNQLLTIDLLDLKERTISLRRANTVLVQSIDGCRSTQLLKAQIKATKLEEENWKLKQKLLETSVEKLKLENKTKKLKNENKAVKGEVDSQVKKTKNSEYKYEGHIIRLQTEFEKLRTSNDKLLSMFKEAVIPVAEREHRIHNHDYSDEVLVDQAQDDSVVQICSTCIENSCSCHNESITASLKQTLRDDPRQTILTRKNINSFQLAPNRSFSKLNLQTEI